MTHLLQLLDLILPNPLNIIAAGHKTSSFFCNLETSRWQEQE